MKTLLLPLLAAGASLMAAVGPAHSEPPPAPGRLPVTAAEAAGLQAAARAAEAGATVPAAVVATYRAAEPATLQAGNGEAQLQTLVRLLRDYRATYGSNPVGNNAEIVRALRGNNPRGMRFADDASAPVSKGGEVLDRWGHPLYFHPISATVLEVRSAGPDGKMWTPDDLVAR